MSNENGKLKAKGVPKFREVVRRLALNLWKNLLSYVMDHPFHLHSALLIQTARRSAWVSP
jgi:hypothetical protein